MNRSVTVVATLTVRVPLGASGSLADGAASVVGRIDAVERVTDTAILALAPGLNDTAADCRVRLELADVLPETAVRRRLDEGVGILAVDRSTSSSRSRAIRPPLRSSANPRRCSAREP
jgi:hypothetical protein